MALQAATRTEHRLTEEFEVSARRLPDTRLLRRRAEGGTYVGLKNLGPMEEAWGLEPPGQMADALC